MSILGWINMHVLFSGLNGVVIDTIKPLNLPYPFLTLTYYDKFHFKYRAKPRGSTVNAILCEKGKVHIVDIPDYTYRSFVTLQCTLTDPY